MDVSKIRESWEIAPQAGVAWFCVDESEVAFAREKAPGPRRVILRAWPTGSPIACVFARTASGQNGLPHFPHFTDEAREHLTDNPRCNLDKTGRIVIGVPLAAKKSVLDHNTARCEEPDPEITRKVLMAPSRPLKTVPATP